MEREGLIRTIAFVVYTVSLLFIVNDGMRRRGQLSRVSYMLRVYGAGFLAIVAIVGIAIRVWEGLR